MHGCGKGMYVNSVMSLIVPQSFAWGAQERRSRSGSCWVSLFTAPKEGGRLRELSLPRGLFPCREGCPGGTTDGPSFWPAANDDWLQSRMLGSANGSACVSAPDPWTDRALDLSLSRRWPGLP